MEDLKNGLMEFVDSTPNAYYCVDNIKKTLIAAGFTQLYEEEAWEDLEEGKNYFVIRSDSSLIAFTMCGELLNPGFNIVATHTDSPSFQIKPNPDMSVSNYSKLNISGYGGMINQTWLDRPLSIAGRVITKDANWRIFRSELVNIDQDLLVIPSQAIHINRSVNDGQKLNIQEDMLPLVSLSPDKKLEDILRNYVSGEICDYDLYLYNRDKAKTVGLDSELILAPRLDDLACVYAALQGFLNSENEQSINVFCAFNNEEIGSLTMQGADSNFLLEVLSKIAHYAHFDIYTAINGSFVISADNAHAVHPNAAGKSDPTNKVLLNRGIAIKHHTSYTTDALSSALFKDICKKASIPYQDFACRSDMLSGSTLGKISQRQVSALSVDIGIPQLAMHSANETIGAEDIEYAYRSMQEFYSTKLVRDKGEASLVRLKH